MDLSKKGDRYLKNQIKAQTEKGVDKKDAYLVALNAELSKRKK